MNDKEFDLFARRLLQHLEQQKVFVKNPERFAEVEQAYTIAQKLFASSTVTIKDDALQMGALVINIRGYDVTVRGQEEIALFSELISKADNFEIYPTTDEKICFALVFRNALTRIS